jgi:hypothetical protein
MPVSLAGAPFACSVGMTLGTYLVGSEKLFEQAHRFVSWCSETSAIVFRMFRSGHSQLQLREDVVRLFINEQSFMKCAHRVATSMCNGTYKGTYNANDAYPQIK